tara:strand:- start:126 stop:1868 length:1743 start_codon:yes stop_codon:yes gene_type:complete
MALTKIDDRGLKTPIDLLDNEYLRLGTGNDLELFHNGNHSFIQDVGTGNLYINSTNGNIHLRTSSNEQAVTCVQNAEVVLYHNNSKKLETTSAGVEVTGTLRTGNGSTISFSDNVNLEDSSGSNNNRIKIGASDDLQIYHSGTDSIIENTQGELQIATDAVMRFQATEYKFNNAANNEKIANFFQDGACELYHDHSKKFETQSSGIKVLSTLQVGDDGGSIVIANGSGFSPTFTENAGDLEYKSNNSKRFTFTHGGDINIEDNRKLAFGGSNQDLSIFHNGTNSIIENATGALVIKPEGLMRIQDRTTDEFRADFNDNGSVDLYHNGDKKFETTSTGIKSESSSDVVFRLTKTAASDAEIKNTNSLDLCCSSGGSGGQIIRFLTGANPSSLVEHMRINGSGHVLFNQSTTNTPGFGNTTVGACMEDIGTNGCALFVSRADSMSLFLNRNNTGQIVSFRQGGNEVGSISTNGTSLPSDRNFKKNMTDLTLGLDFVNTLKPSKYNLKLEEDTDPLLFGLIAQDVEESLTAAGVTKNSTVLCQHNPTESETESDYNLDYGKFIPILINAIKELSTKVAALEAA